MYRRLLLGAFLLSGLLVIGCGQSNKDSRVNLSRGVGSDSFGDSILIRPIGDFISALIGEGLEVETVKTKRNSDGIMVAQISVYNKSTKTRRFQYKVNWVDADGFTINTKTSVWLDYSVAAKSSATITSVAPNARAVNFKINTRK